MLFLILIHYIWAIFTGLNLIYTFQIKEYRLDRFRSVAKETGVLRFLYTFKFRLPAFSLRNVLIVFLFLTAMSLLFLYSFEQKNVFDILAKMFFLAPFTSFMFVSIGVFVTSIPSTIIRSIIRFRAIKKVQQSKAIFIGITGSYGKTSTKEYLTQVLSSKFKVAKTPKNMNTDVGIALSILRLLKPSTEICIIELGAYRTGELKTAASYIPFKYSILTGLGNQHVDLYGSREALVKEETSPIVSLAKHSKAYVNFDSVTENEVNLSHIQAVTFGTSKDADIKLIQTSSSTEGTRGIVHYHDKIFHISSQLLGIHSLENILPAIAIASDLGIDTQTIEKQISKITPLNGKLSKHIGPNNSLVLHDGVNSNLNGFLAAIDVMRIFNHTKKIIMTQGIIELGVEKRESYASILQKLNETNIELFTTDKLFHTIKSNVQINTFNDVSSMEKQIRNILDEKSLLLIEGSFSKPILKQLIPETVNGSTHYQ